MSDTGQFDVESHERLHAVIARLDPILNPHGFIFHTDSNAVSIGPFENGFYKRPPIQIGLIVRGGSLGVPLYYYGERNCCDHVDLIERLGRLNESLLRVNIVDLVTTDRSDVVDALFADIKNIILPHILNDLPTYEQVVTAAYQDWYARLCGTR